jgi:hypothetical protein
MSEGERPHLATGAPDVGIPIDFTKRLEILLGNLKDAYHELIDANLKISGVLLIVLGWFAAKVDPLPMLCFSSTFTRLALIFTAVGPIALTYLFVLLYTRATDTYADLLRLGYDETLFKRFKATKAMVACGLFGQYVMLIGIFSAIYIRYVMELGKPCSS